MDHQGKDHVKFSGTSNANDTIVYKPASVNTEALWSTIGSHVGTRSPPVFQLKERSCIDLSRVKLSEVMKSNSLDNAATQSLLSAVYGILDESIGRKNGEIPQRVAGILRNFVQEIERRICTQREHLTKQSSLFKTREEKYQSRIKVLEALAAGTTEEEKSEKSKTEEKRTGEELDVQAVIKQKDDDSQRLLQQKELDMLDVQRVVKHKDDNLQRLVQEKEKDFLDVQRLMKDREEEFHRLMRQKEDSQRLLEKKVQELQKLVQEKEQNLLDAQILMKDREEEFLRVRRQNEEGAGRLLGEEVQVLQKLTQQKDQRLLQATEKDVIDGERVMKGREEDFQGLTKQKEEDAQRLLHEKVVELQKLVQEKEQNLLDVHRVMKDKEEVFQRAIKQKNEEVDRLLKEKMCDLQELAQRRENRLEQGTEQDLFDVPKLMKEKEEEFQRLMKQKEEDMQRVVHEKEQDLEKLVKEKAQDLERMEHKEQDMQRLVEEEKIEMQRLVQENEQVMHRLLKEKEELNIAVVNLREELEATKQAYEQETLKTKEEAKGVQQELELQLKETVGQFIETKNKVQELEALSESNSHRWKKKQHLYQLFTEYQLGALRELRFTSQSIQQEIVKTKKSYSEEFNILGSRFQVLDNAAKNYYSLLSENQKIHNELQDLKGNIRVYCRIRPFLPGQKSKQSITEHIGENGELVISNPSKPGKEGRRSFKFNKVYGPSATQAEVFSDTKPLVQSVLDGYNVCIFAYGQTGSGKTYTMMGPDGGTEEEWGVNYRALNNLFNTSQGRESSFTYEISVQMVEIYNEQVRDLLSSDGAQKRLGISSATQSGQSNGLAVPDASIHPVSSTSDVLELTNIGQNNRAKSATAMNERSSRSHSVLSIHIRGTDLKSGSSLRGSLHLVDLAGSERVDRSEVTGDRLKEAQHINKSLAALGDVIFALAQKSSHIPYRNSKLTQVLQSSLGGQAKTLMFVQINPDAVSYSESLSTLKFAERVSGVELGAARSSKDGRDVRELMEQVSSLKDTIAKKDEEIEALQLAANSQNTV